MTALKILVVDDDADARELIAAILRECGADVTIAVSVTAALDIVVAAKPDVILADLGMPGEDGYDLIRRLRALGPGLRDIPAVAITAYVSVEDRDRALAAGYGMHLAKPVEPAELARAVAQVTRGMRG